MRAGLLWLVACSCLVSACVSTRVTNYRALPLPAPAAAAADTAHATPAEAAPSSRNVAVERDGVRVTAGPPSVFPYRRELSKRSKIIGQYQLFTRVLVENESGAPVEVFWSRARLVGPEGQDLRLLDAAAAPVRDPAAQPAAAWEAETVPVGARTLHALIPETLLRIEVDQPLVKLCDDCEYRLLLPVRIGGSEELIELAFRLEEKRARRSRARFLFWQ